MTDNRRLANALRILSIDAIQKANSGHPGMPMGMADIAQVLWGKYLRHNPQNPAWANRDRFVLSNGHGSMLLYSLLHLSGYDLSIDDLKNFRQLHSKTPGHPEYGYTAGVETTTGPLGQGLANAVGMALAQKILAAQFNRDDHEIIDHFTYAFCGDGCLMEGISHEVCSLAGTWGLGKLIVFWDDNKISIDGNTDGWFSDNTPDRFAAYNWQVIKDVDGHDADAIARAIDEAHGDLTRPTIICCKTHIGFGSPNKVDTAGCHGSPLGDAEIQLVREQLDWTYAPFEMPQDVVSSWNAKESGAKIENSWNAKFATYSEKYPKLAAELQRRLAGELPQDWQSFVKELTDTINNNGEKIATRKASQKVLNSLVPKLPEMLGGSADLTGSNLTNARDCKDITRDDFSGNYLRYGVREFGMSAIMNGLALYGGFVPFGGTFLVFSDYSRNALRMAAMMKIRVVFVLSHDSIGLGEDGPTHQPVEQISSLRLIPNMNVWRPADDVETAIAWQSSIENKTGPTALVLTRQGVPHIERDSLENIQRGGYVVYEPAGKVDLILLATGSEVSLALDAAKKSAKNVRVVSMPCTNIFDKQSDEYKKQVLPLDVKTIAIEAGVSDFWYKYIGRDGKVIGIDRFGESAPANELFELFGFADFSC